MRISRDVGRPLVAFVVVVAAALLVSNVAAIRASTTQRANRVDTGTCAKATNAPYVDDDGGRRRDGDRDADRCRSESGDGREVGESGEYGGGGDSSGGVIVVTHSGAS